MVEMQHPDPALRQKLYAHYLQRVETPERTALIAYLAERDVASVREVIGVVNRLVAAADMAGAQLTVALAKTELDSGLPVQHAPDAPAADGYFLDDEKIIWHLSDLGLRLIEDPK